MPDKLNFNIGYHEHYCERGDGDKRGGGLAVIWKEGINLLPWDFVLPDRTQYLNKERQWYILAVKGEQFAIMNVYLAFESMGSGNGTKTLQLSCKGR